MGHEIVWTPTALRTFQKNIDYLQEHWTDREITNFVTRVSDFLSTLSHSPRISRESYKVKNTRIGLIVKQVSVVYRVKPRKKVIELITFIDNRTDTKKSRWK